MKHRIFDGGIRALFVALAFLLAFGANPVFAQQDSLEGFDFGEGEYQFSPEELQQLQELYGSQGADSLSPFIPPGDITDADYGTSYGSDVSGAFGPSSFSLLPLLLGGLGGVSTGKSVLLFLGAYILILLLIALVLFIAAFKNYKRFSREQALVFGWNAMKKHIWLFVLIFIVQLIVWAVFALLAYFAMKYGPATLSVGWIIGNLLIIVIALFFFLLFSVGLTKISLKALAGKPFGVADLFNGVNVLFKYFLAGVVYFVIVAGPFIVLRIALGLMKDLFSAQVLLIGGLVAVLLLAIPVSLWFMKFFLWGIVVVDKGVWPLTALKLSSQYTARAKTDVALFNILLFGINLIGSNVPLMLGLFVSFPVTLIAYGHMYRQLEKG
ncbi:hypothetical protein HYV71_04555 [Candidatus Uhrbacteria bacterium]|nr:hypothetical protein [Candidatus Uhrbacteria bacterium]